MLSALVEDFQALPGCEVWTLLDHECPALGTQHRRRVAPHQAEEEFRSLAAQADATLVIAPETHGVLARLTRLVSDFNGRLLGCSAEAVELTADKKALAEHWHKHHVPTPELVESSGFPGFPVVLKPRDGAGSQATFRIRNREEWTDAWQQARQDMASEFLVQRFVSGQPASVAFLIGPGQVMPLASAAQHLSDDGRFHYLGGLLPLEPSLAERATSLAIRAIAGIPGLAGYVGVDVVLGSDVQEDVAIEINPRLTTSYLGLRRLAQSNLAEAWLNIAQGQRPRAISWRQGPIRFGVDGSIVGGPNGATWDSPGQRPG